MDIPNVEQSSDRLTSDSNKGMLSGLFQWGGATKTGKEWKVYKGDANTVLAKLPASSFDCVITSPPYYWLRDYGVAGQLGQEDSVEAYVSSISSVMDQVRRLLKDEGVLFLNIGDTYYSGKGEAQGVDPKSRKRRFGLRAVDKSGGLGIGLKQKTAIGVPWRVAIEMCNRDWILRSPIIWNRVYALPEAVKDRPRRTYEYIFLFVKNRKYYFNRPALLATNEHDVWNIKARPKPTNGINTAPYPDELVGRCLDIGCPPGGSVLDPFAGSGTTLRVALNRGHSAAGVELNHEFCDFMISHLSKL